MTKIEKYISDIEVNEILSFVRSLNVRKEIRNKHINSVASKLNGDSHMFDITKTNMSKELSAFQSSGNVIDMELPDIFSKILNRICSELRIPKDNVFLQVLNQEKGGVIHPHYDSAINGYITFKCNMCIQSEEYQIFVGDDIFNIKQGDLYCFEASLYKHWTLPLTSSRVILSWGFILPYHLLGRNESDPRVRLSKRIINYFQDKKD